MLMPKMVIIFPTDVAVTGTAVGVPTFKTIVRVETFPGDKSGLKKNTAYREKQKSCLKFGWSVVKR